MIKLDKDLRVSFAYLIQRSANDGRVPITIVRAGKPMQIQLPVSAQHPTLVTDLRGGYPVYFLYRPLVVLTGPWAFVSPFEDQAGLLRIVGAAGTRLSTWALDTVQTRTEERRV